MDQNLGGTTAATARATASPQARAWACIPGLCLCLALTGCQYGGTELHSQEELSDAAGEFAASRYLVYRGSDDKYHHFQETGKFGPLGPAGKFRISKQMLALPTLAPGALITYDQNQGVFRLRDGGVRHVIKADFVERYTREEERYLKAIDAARPYQAAGPSPQKNLAWHAALRASFDAGHFDEAERHGQELLAMLRDIPRPNDTGDLVHSTHTYLGLIAMKRKDLPGAAQHLLASAEEAQPTPVLTSFGPSMALARELTLAGQWEVVARYLSLCERFWPQEKLRAWREDVENRRAPTNWTNLFYHR